MADFFFQFSRYQDDLAKPEGRLFFAGEHTDFPHAWMDAAIKSAIRAAAEIHMDEDWTLKRGFVYNQTPWINSRTNRRPTFQTTT